MSALLFDYPASSPLPQNVVQPYGQGPSQPYGQGPPPGYNYPPPSGPITGQPGVAHPTGFVSRFFLKKFMLDFLRLIGGYGFYAFFTLIDWLCNVLRPPHRQLFTERRHRYHILTFRVNKRYERNVRYINKFVIDAQVFVFILTAVNLVQCLPSINLLRGQTG